MAKRLKRTATNDEHELGLIRSEKMDLYRHYGDEAYRHPRYAELEARAAVLRRQVFGQPDRTA